MLSETTSADATEVTKVEERETYKSNNTSSCRVCGRDVLPANLVLHEAHCGKKDRQGTRPSSAVSVREAAKKEKKKEKKKKTPTQVSEDNIVVKTGLS